MAEYEVRKPAIALVDDNRLIRQVLKMLLQKEGFIVHTFGCPIEFLRSHVVAQLDCILTDLDMPIMNGCELQAEVGRRHPDLPVVFVTGSEDDGQRRRALRQGAYAFLRKPTRISQLVTILNDAVASYSHGRLAFGKQTTTA